MTEARLRTSRIAPTSRNLLINPAPLCAEQVSKFDEQPFLGCKWRENLGQHDRHVVATSMVICQFNQLLTNDIKTSIKSADS